MKKQTMDGQISPFNTQKSFLEKSIEHLPNTETTNALTSFSKIEKTMEILKNQFNVEKTCIEKIFQTSTQCAYARSVGGGAAI